MDISDLDPKGLIQDSYRIEGIGLGQCRSIFLDWALSVPVGADTSERIKLLLKTYGQAGHPMTEILNEGLAASPKAKRRGGRAARFK